MLTRRLVITHRDDVEEAAIHPLTKADRDPLDPPTDVFSWCAA